MHFQISGNLLILAKKFINLYTFQVKTHDISKLKFIDFEELPLLIELSFNPTQVAFCENYIACMNKDSMHLFKISQTVARESANETNTNNDNEYNFICKYSAN